MPQELLKESAAWREIARRIAEGEWRELGLCAEVDDLRWADHLIESVMWNAMYDRKDGHHDFDADMGTAFESGGYVFPRGEQDVCVVAALFLALEAESEGK